MGIYLIYWICFIAALIPAWIEGTNAGVGPVGTLIGFLVGIALGAGHVFAFRAFLLWVIRTKPGDKLSESAWFVLDIFLFFACLAWLFGIGAIAGFVSKSAIHLVAK